VAATTNETACLFCSLCCPAGVAVDEYGLTTPEYPGHTPGSHHGLCHRGHLISELVGHPGRLHEAMVREGEQTKTVPSAEAMHRVADLLPADRDDLAVVIDGNLPCEELVAAVRSAREGLGIRRVVIFIPPADEAMLCGLSTSAATRLGEPALADCDVILAIGDPFATHPVIGAAILDAVAKARGHRLLNIDSLRGRTARFAGDFCQVRPGGEAAALAGLLRAMGAGESVPGLPSLAVAAEMAGVDAGSLEALAGSLAKAERLGVVVSLPEGRCGAAAAASALAAKVAEARGGGVCPLPAYGNAAGAYRLAAALGTTSLSQLMEDIRAGRVKRLIVAGTDLVSAVPVAELASVEILVAASPMATATTARARVVLPMAMWFEIGGTVVDGAGRQRTAGAVSKPPRGALAASAILRAAAGTSAKGQQAAGGDLAQLLATEPRTDAAAVLGDPSQWEPPKAEGKLLVVSRADAVGFADGCVSRQLAWPVLMELRPTVRLHPAEAGGLRGGTATLRSNGLAVELAVEASEGVPRGVAAISPRFPELRALFAWAEPGVGPGLVSMEKGSGNDQ